MLWEISKLNKNDLISKSLLGMYRIQKVSKRRFDLRLNGEKLSKHGTQKDAKNAAHINYGQHFKSEG